MKIIDLYGPFITSFEKSNKLDLEAALKTNEKLNYLREMAEEWGTDLQNVHRWMTSAQYLSQREVANRFVHDAPSVIEKIQGVFGEVLKGEVQLSPSLMRFDGFARYELGYHTVWFGVDHPDASDIYLRALLSHELSHVYRDHQPRVWAFLKKPLEEVSRQEYLDNMSASEHLVSEGLATLFSQIVFPEIPLHIHHYYFQDEMEWCLTNLEAIDKAIRDRMKKDEDVWSFYSDNAVGPGSPSRTQYFWAARVLSEWLPKRLPGKSLKDAVIEVHGWPAAEFDCFKF